MSQEQETKAGEYRKTAATLRLLASQVRFHDGSARLLALANNFEKLADRVEAWHAAPSPDQRSGG